MRVLSSVLFLASSAFAYQVTYPGDNQGWNTTGPNVVVWERVGTDPTTFAMFLTNVNTNSNQLLISSVNGSLGSIVASPPQGGWSAGSGFRVNFAQDSSHPNSLLAQSSQFNITVTSSSQSTTSGASTQTASGTVAATSNPSVSSSDTSTTPTGTNAAPLSADTPTGLLSAVATLLAIFTALF